MEKKATREAYGKALVEIGKDSRVVVLDADLSGSTKSALFKKAYPDRFFNMGIAESNMAGVAAGMALSGLKPYVSSFAIFVAGRAFEPIRQSICYQNLHVVLCGSHSGISVGEDGGSHQAVEDIALMRSLPNMKVIVPADYNETMDAVVATLQMEGPVYIRTSRAASPILFKRGEFEFGRAKRLREGDDMYIVACGMLVWVAVEAAKLLQQDGISAGVINMSTVKPIDRDAVCEAAATKRIVTLEEHSIIGGLGSSVSEVLSESCPVKLVRIGLEDVFGESGSKVDLFCKYGFTPEAVVEKIKRSFGWSSS